jgi:hypothetical protein
MYIFYAAILFLCIIAFTYGLWGGGILVFFLFGCCFAGFIMLCHIAVLSYRKIKDFVPIVTDWIKSFSKWLSKHKRAIGIGCIVLAILCILSILYCFTDIFSSIINYLKQHDNKEDITVITSVAIGTIVSIMAIAFPVLVTVIDNLSNRYQNNYIVTEFRNNKALKSFKYSLYISLGLSVGWIVCYYFLETKIWYNLIMFLLLIATITLVICLLYLIWKIIDFMTPNKLVDIIKDRIKNLIHPSYYFDRQIYRPIYAYGSNEEMERMQKLHLIENYDAETTRLYATIACLYAQFREDMIVRKSIEDFWKEKCRIASYITKEKIKYFTNCYYNFIYEAFDYAIEHNDPATQIRVMIFLSILLNSHLGEPRKYREPESEIHKIKHGLSWETIECMWIAMQKSINCPNEGMFREYWQVAYNFYSRKYLNPIDRSVECPISDKMDNEQSFYYTIHYLGCSYLIGCKKYNLLDFALNYSQCMPFKWYLMPDNVLDVVKTYTIIKDWYSDLNNQERFSLKNSRNLYDKVIASRPIEQFTCLLLILLWDDTDSSHHRMLDSPNTTRYLDGLLYVLRNTTVETDWIKYFHIEEYLTKKESIVKWLSQHKQD